MGKKKGKKERLRVNHHKISTRFLVPTGKEGTLRNRSEKQKEKEKKKEKGEEGGEGVSRGPYPRPRPRLS